MTTQAGATTTTETPAPGTTTTTPAPATTPAAGATTPATTTTTPAPGTTTTETPAPKTETTTTAGAATTTTEAGKPAPGATPAAGAPETYALTLPANLEGSDLTAFQTWAKGLGLTNEEAQAELDVRGEGLAKQSAAWLAETQAHSEIGGDKLAAAQTRARAVLERYLPAGTPDGDRLRQAFDRQGYGNFPPLVVLLARIGKDLAEDTGASRAGGGAGPTRDPATVLYGGTAAKA